MISKLSIIDFLEIYPGDTLAETSLGDVPNIKSDCTIREIKYIQGIPENMPPDTKGMITVGQKDFNKDGINETCDLLTKNTGSKYFFLHCFFERRRSKLTFDIFMRLTIIIYLIKKSSSFECMNIFALEDDVLCAAPLLPKYPKEMLSCTHYLSFRFWINEITFVLKSLLLKTKMSVVVKCH